MIIVDQLGNMFAKRQTKTFKGIIVDPFPHDMKREIVVYNENVRVIPYRAEFWANDDKETGQELAMKKEVRNWKMIPMWGDASGGTARVSPNDISYIKTRF